MCMTKRADFFVPSVPSSRGFTLIEFLITLVILGAAGAGIMAAVTAGAARSADPMIQTQGVIIAQGYLEEAMLKAYDNPPGGHVCAFGESPRNLFDDVLDYNCVNDVAGALDQNGNSLVGLNAYNVAMRVSDTNINGAPARRIVVNVTHDGSSINIEVAAYRTDY